MEPTGFEPTDWRSQYATPSLRRMRSKPSDQGERYVLTALWAVERAA